MSSSTRSPKDLKRMVTASQKDVDEMQENLEKLKNLTRDDKTESALLRSRIDEQSQLICILKRRSDDAVLRVGTLEKVNKELETFREKAQEMLAEELKKSRMLERRFQELAENHEELIRFKDDYKRQNESLRRDNDRLRSENSALFSAALDEKAQQIASMEKQLTGLKEQCKEYEHMIRSLKMELSDQEQRYQSSLAVYEEKLSHQEHLLQETDHKLQKYKESVEAEASKETLQVEKLRKERQEFLDLAMQRGKILQERQQEIKRLEEGMRSAETRAKLSEQKFEREAEAVSVNLRVMRLNRERESAEKTQRDLKMEYEAFKKHSLNLLNKEKDLNAQLRNLVG